MPGNVNGYHYLSLAGLEIVAARKGTQNSSSHMSSCCNYTCMPRQNSNHIANDIFKCIFLNENVLISLKISMKSVLKFHINNFQALQIMAWHLLGFKPLSEPVMVSLPTHICIKCILAWYKVPRAPATYRCICEWITNVPT